MSRRHEQLKEEIFIPEPFVYCPLTENANDTKGHLSWTTNTVSQYSLTLGARFGGSNYMRCNNSFSFANIKTLCYYVRFDSIPTDGNSNTWHVMHYIRGNNNESYRYYGMLQHFSNENAELTNCAVAGGSFNQNTSVLTTPFGSTLVNTWYKIALRVNASQNNVTVFIDTYKKDISGTIPTSASCDIKLGAHPNNVRYLKGYMKDFRIWDVELTDEQIAAL